MIKFSRSLMKALGLTPAQTDVYLAALELGRSSMQELARKSGVKRTTIYKFIDELKERGLIIETKRKTRSVYAAVSPQQLLEFEKYRLAELTELMPQLQAIENAVPHKPKVMFYEGIDAVKELYLDILKAEKSIVAWSDLSGTLAAFGQFGAEFADKRARRNIELKWIVPDTAEARAFTRRDYGLLRETKFLPNAQFAIDINIYDNKVVLVNARSPQPFGVLIEDRLVADTLREAWQQLWVRL